MYNSLMVAFSENRQITNCDLLGSRLLSHWYSSTSIHASFFIRGPYTNAKGPTEPTRCPPTIGPIAYQTQTKRRKATDTVRGLFVASEARQRPPAPLRILKKMKASEIRWTPRRIASAGTTSRLESGVARASSDDEIVNYAR